MPILNKSNGSEPLNGIEYDCYASNKPVYKNQIYQLGCDVNHITTTNKDREIGSNLQFAIWCKLDDKRIFLLDYTQTRMTVSIDGRVLVVNEDVATRADTPFLNDSTTETIADSAYFLGVDNVCICKLSNTNPEVVVSLSKITFFYTRINDTAIGETDAIDMFEDGLGTHYGDMFSNGVDDEFVYITLDTDKGTLYVYKYQYNTEIYDFVALRLFNQVGFTGYELLRVIQLSNNDYYAVFSSVVNSITIISFYHISVDSEIKTQLVDKFTLDLEYSTLYCTYNEGYVTITGFPKGNTEKNIRVFVFFISKDANIVQVYHKFDTIAQDEAYTAVAGIMTYNDGLAYMVHKSSSTLSNTTKAGFNILSDPANPSYPTISLTSGNAILYKTAPPIICNNNVYFLYAWYVSRQTSVNCFAYFVDPITTSFYPYNNLYGLCQKDANMNSPTSILYPKP